MSDAEPELGLGVVLSAKFGRVEILFPAAEERREYALESAPVRRVEFSVGDRVETHEGSKGTVENVKEENGFLSYLLDSEWVPEAALSDTISFSSPIDRMQGGQLDNSRSYMVRLESLEWQAKIRKAPTRGLIGSRIDLINHQLYIAEEVTQRLNPRVLLADEVGLGKTIEAALIMHRLHLTGRADRVLVILPDSLVHQWFIELLRRFNMMFTVFDEERCVAADEHPDGAQNPFAETQHALMPLSMLVKHPRRLVQTVEAGWDLMIVDEAHHLEWSEDQVSDEYAAVEELAKSVPALLLLTATPQQLGAEGHFARLRLLDPDRYSDLAKFVSESEHYQEAADLIDHVDQQASLDITTIERIQAVVPHMAEQLPRARALDDKLRRELEQAILDTFGTGRVIFRNTRAALGGFPKRLPELIPLKGLDDDPTGMEPKIEWLVDWLKANPGRKALLICRSRELVEDLSEQILEQINVDLAVFHEALNLVQRDRNAAFFQDEEGARLLLCSEIGSEGRNFQFAHTLILWDLPENPELLEQRIGRLDRIGQTTDIQILVPYIDKGPEAVWAKWYLDGVGALSSPVPTAMRLKAEFEDRIHGLAEKYDGRALTSLIKATAKKRAEWGEEMERGMLKLLALNSFDARQSETMKRSIAITDQDKTFENFILQMLEELGVRIEEMGARRYLLDMEYGRVERLPGLESGPMTVTFDRADALGREDIHFLTVDHPLVRSAFDALLSSEHGNTAVSVFQDCKVPGLFLESVFVIECLAPQRLHVDRYLPRTPVGILVNHKREIADFVDLDGAFEARDADHDKILNNPGIKGLIPKMLEAAKSEIEAVIETTIDGAEAEMRVQINREIIRLEELSEVNDGISQGEIDSWVEHRGELAEALRAARPRLDAMRLIVCEQ